MMEWGGTMFGGIGMLLFWGVIIVLLLLAAFRLDRARHPA
jgi:hypothetical protein